MIDKKTFLNNFSGEDLNYVQNLYDKYKFSGAKDISAFGNEFYPPNVWSYFQSILKNDTVTISTYGYFEEAERRMIAFNNRDNAGFPLKVIQIRNKSKFNKITHRDYLGAILSLGIKREKLGDLIVIEDSCFFPIFDEMENFILSEVSNVFKFPVEVYVVDSTKVIEGTNFEDHIIMAQSLRLDSIVTKLSNTSRTKAKNIIEQGKVLLNYQAYRDSSKELKENDRLTIRGVGKFKLGEIIGHTNSGKLKIIIKKYT